MRDVLLAIGTRKGLFLARSSEGGPFEVDPVRFSTIGVPSVAIDTRGPVPRILAGIEYGHFGPSVLRSDDLGGSWQEGVSASGAPGASGASISFPEATATALTRVWQLQPSASEPEVVWAGAEPGALFRSEDRGVTFSLVEGLWNHPHRSQWQPGQGGLCLHTVLVHPGDSKTVLVAVSAGGVYRTEDGGTSWRAANRGIRAPFLPEGAQYPEFGQCVHKVDMHPSRPERLFLQHHGGVYRSDDFGDSWTPIGASLPSDFGFPLVVHPDRPDTLYVFPLQGDQDRTPPGHRCRVFRSDDAGGSWRALEEGLPAGPVHAAVLRDAMCASAGGVFFGTRDGEVHGSWDDGESWFPVAAHLPDVLTVRAAAI
ncbi:WD40/YVTN/BNR-like repeat-containing protein [Streptosporangium sp. DT93]|uniref:WD40/YVTN/BNR-like repeat-containing protein n=1 Tax=Streptosporangium sp. DT93 TaxID=3393428 RepID=UPI003CEF57AE